MTNTTIKIKSKELISFYDTDSPASEAFRALRTNIMFRNIDKPIKLVNVISNTAAEGKSTVALNLAITYSQLNKKVLVIDLDLRIPSIHKKLNIRNKTGITDIIYNNATFEECKYSLTQNIDVITAGTKIIYQAEFVQSQALKQFLDKMKEQYDFIILDCPPVGLVTDGVILSNYTDGTIFVCESNKNNRTDLLRVKKTFDDMNTNILGTVITKVPMTKKYYSNYRYSDSHKSKDTIISRIKRRFNGSSKSKPAHARGRK